MVLQGDEAESSRLRQRLAEADSASLASGATAGGAGALVMVRKVRALEAQLAEAQREITAAKSSAMISATQRAGSAQVEALRFQLEDARNAAAEEARARGLEQAKQVRGQRMHLRWYLLLSSTKL